MPDQNGNSPAQLELESFCKELLQSHKDAAIHDELLDHLLIAFAEETAAGHDPAEAIQRTKRRFGNPANLAPLLVDAGVGGITRRAIEFVVAWLCMSGVTQLIVFVSFNVVDTFLRRMSWNHVVHGWSVGYLYARLDLPPSTELTQLAVALVMTAALLNRWRQGPPRPRRLSFALALGLLAVVCFDSPLNLFFESVVRLRWHPNASRLLTFFDPTSSASFVAMVALGLIACRHIRVLDGTRAGLTCLALAAGIAVTSTLHVLGVILVNMYVLHSFQYFTGVYGSLLVFCVIAADVAWTISWCIEFATTLPKRFQFVR